MNNAYINFTKAFRFDMEKGQFLNDSSEKNLLKRKDGLFSY